MKTPPCATWNTWFGDEIEGSFGLGSATLFIRHTHNWRNAYGQAQRLLAAKNQEIKRLWFCHEFTDWKQIAEAGNSGLFEKGSICLEVTPATYDRVPKKVLEWIKVYYKLDVRLKKEDQICIGPAFSDEAFVIGAGASVTPAMYLKDTRLT